MSSGKETSGLRVLAVCLEGAGGAEGAAAAGVLEERLGGRLDRPARVDLPPGGLRPGPWVALAAAGLRLGLIHPPAQERVEEVAGFMVARGREVPPPTHPAALARDLYDFPPAPAWCGRSGLETLPRSRRDTMFAEAAALLYIRCQHALRLFSAHGVEVAVLGLEAVGHVRALFPGDEGRRALMLAQVAAGVEELAVGLAPASLLVWGMSPQADEAGGWLLAWGRAWEPPRGRLRVEASDPWELVADLALGRRLSGPWAVLDG